MILDKNTQEKPNIEYPAKWGFKVIGKDKVKVEQAVKDVMDTLPHSCNFSNTSKSGKFNSYSIECVVESEEQRDELYKNFGEHSDVDYVI